MNDLSVTNSHSYNVEGLGVHNSAAGCLISYLVGITTVDPIEYGLLMERFYHEGRKGSLPDIDIDFPPESREEAVDYLRNKYGHSRVCQMATYGRLQGRSALGAVLRVNDICTFMQAKEITKQLPKEDKISDKLAEMDHPSVIRWTLENEPKRVRDYCFLNEDGELEGEYAKVFEQALRLEGTLQSMGKHAAGVIVSAEDLESVCPLIKETHADEKIGGMEMNNLESIGLVKLDVLGLSCLSKIMAVCSQI